MDRFETLVSLLPPWLQWHPDGEIRLAGHRLGFYHFIYYYNQGFTAEMLLCQFPTLELALIHKVIAFYLENRVEVDRYVTQYQADIDRLRASGKHAAGVFELRKRHEGRELAESVDIDRV